VGTRQGRRILIVLRGVTPAVMDVNLLREPRISVAQRGVTPAEQQLGRVQRLQEGEETTHSTTSLVRSDRLPTAAEDRRRGKDMAVGAEIPTIHLVDRARLSSSTRNELPCVEKHLSLT